MFFHHLFEPKALNVIEWRFFNHAAMIVEMEDFSYFCKKKTVIYTNLLVFLQK